MSIDSVRAFFAEKAPEIAVIEAATIEDAIALVAGTPCSVAHGVVEVWPLEVAPAT